MKALTETLVDPRGDFVSNESPYNSEPCEIQPRFLLTTNRNTHAISTGDKVGDPE